MAQTDRISGLAAAGQPHVAAACGCVNACAWIPSSSQWFMMCQRWEPAGESLISVKILGDRNLDFSSLKFAVCMESSCFISENYHESKFKKGVLMLLYLCWKNKSPRLHRFYDFTLDFFFGAHSSGHSDEMHLMTKKNAWDCADFCLVFNSLSGIMPLILLVQCTLCIHDCHHLCRVPFFLL